MSSLPKRAIEILKDKALLPEELADALGIPPRNSYYVVARLRRKGHQIPMIHGRYQLVPQYEGKEESVESVPEPNTSVEKAPRRKLNLQQTEKRYRHVLRLLKEAKSAGVTSDEFIDGTPYTKKQINNTMARVRNGYEIGHRNGRYFLLSPRKETTEDPRQESPITESPITKDSLQEPPILTEALFVVIRENVEKAKTVLNPKNLDELVGKVQKYNKAYRTIKGML